MPGGSCVSINAFQQQARGVAKIDKMIRDVNHQRIEANYPKKEGPFLIAPHIDQEIESSQQQESHPTGQEDKRATPQVLVNRKMNAP